MRPHGHVAAEALVAALVITLVAAAGKGGVELRQLRVEEDSPDRLLMPTREYMYSHTPLDLIPYEYPTEFDTEPAAPLNKVRGADNMVKGAPTKPGGSAKSTSHTSRTETMPTTPVWESAGKVLATTALKGKSAGQAGVGGAPITLPEAPFHEGSGYETTVLGDYNSAHPVGPAVQLPPAREVQDEDPEEIKAVDPAALAAFRVEQLRLAYEGVLPAVDRHDGAPADSRTTGEPKPPAIEIITGGNLFDVPAVNYSATRPSEDNRDGDDNDGTASPMPTGPVPATFTPGSGAEDAPMPEIGGELALEPAEVPCATCPGHPHNTCSKHGVCVNGTCECHAGWRGDDCAERMCPQVDRIECAGHGVCRESVCSCDDGWMGDACADPWPGCPVPGPGLPECSGVEHGTCRNKEGTCECRAPWTGAACNSIPCPEASVSSGTDGTSVHEAECAGRGKCVFGTCVCELGYVGPNCGAVACPNMCSGHGRCDAGGVCTCAVGWGGEACLTTACPTDDQGLTCGGNGQCSNAGLCECGEGWRGVDCTVRRCAGFVGECNDHGTCADGLCVCDSGWSGDACQQRDCTATLEGHAVCSGHGECWHGVCQCGPGWAGPECAGQRCPEDCNSHGSCADGVCVCDAAWAGRACEQARCPTGDSNDYDGNAAECSGRGMCVRGHCLCNDDFKGVACQLAACPGYDPANPDEECSVHGHCINGSCICDPKWHGSACELKHCTGSPDKICSGHGQCSAAGDCRCDAGWEGLDCSSESCRGEPACSGKGSCLHGQCICNAGYKGQDCEIRECSRGPLPGNAGVTAECSGNGECQPDGKCQCVEGWKGTACSIYARCPGFPSECSGNGRCAGGASDDKYVCACFPGWRGDDCAIPAGFEGECENGTAWSDCVDTAMTCPELPADVAPTARLELSGGCLPGCQCTDGLFWQQSTRQCVRGVDCLPHACGAVIDDDESVNANNSNTVEPSGTLSILTSACNFSAAELTLASTYKECVCVGRPLTVCWNSADDTDADATNTISSEATLSLYLKTFDSFSEVSYNLTNFRKRIP